MKSKVFGGSVLEAEGKNIKAIISLWGRMIEVGQRVISNGRVYPDGLGGMVVKIHQPYEGGKTSDVIEVLFDGDDYPISLKFKDLV